MNVLGIETSCDETAAAVVRDGREVLSNVVASQAAVHATWGGVVPEIACRAHLETLTPAIDEALARAGIGLGDVDAVAVTTHPGLIGALLVGVAAAKGLAFALGKPLVGVDHIEAHIYANILAPFDELRANGGEHEPPFVSFIISGGHTTLFEWRGPGDMDRLGETRDDAAGEAFDKVAALLGLPYPGGPSVEKAARAGRRDAIRFPRTSVGHGAKHRRPLDTSFAGLKTAVLYYLRGQDASRPGAPGPYAPPEGVNVADVAASFQEAAVDVLVDAAVRAVERRGVERLAVGGGVAANGRLRERLEEAARRHGFRLFIPPRSLCTDNAAMIAGLGYHNLRLGRDVGLEIEARAR